MAGWERDLRTAKLSCTRRYAGLAEDGNAWHGTLAAATGVGVAALAVAGAEQLADEIAHVLPDPDDELVAEALRRAAPHVDPVALSELEGVELKGMSVLVRGAVGEVLAVDLLANGELPCPPGVERVDLADFRQPGHDLELLGGHGDVVALANVKVAGTADVIVRHLAQHPDVPVVYASSDAVHDLAGDVTVIGRGGSFPDDWVGDPIVVDLGRTSDELDGMVDEAIDAIVGFDVDLDDLLLELPAVVVGAALARFAWRWASTEAPASDLTRTARTEIVGGFTSRGAGLAVGAVTGVPVLRSLTSLTVSFSQRTVRAARSRVQMSADRVVRTTAALHSLRRRREQT